MKFRHFILLTFIALINSCEISRIEPNDSQEFVVKTLIVGDTSNCYYVDFEKGISFGDDTGYLDINLDTIPDINFVIFSVWEDNCDEFYENCDSNEICDCWPTIYYEHTLELTSNTQIAVDNNLSCLLLNYYDTLSNQTNWSSLLEYPLAHNTPDYSEWPELGEFYIGLRKTQYGDTTFSWIKMELRNAGFQIKEFATKTY